MYVSVQQFDCYKIRIGHPVFGNIELHLYHKGMQQTVV